MSTLIFERGENMVRKAETLESLDELELYLSTCTYLKRNFESLDDVVKYGRKVAFERDDAKFLKRDLELANALEEAGFIRPKEDFERMLCIGRLYCGVFGEYYNSIIMDIEQLSNEQYENFADITEEDIRSVKIALINQLTDKEYEVICRRFGLEGKLPDAYASIGRSLNLRADVVHQLEANALKKILYNNKMPALFDASKNSNQKVIELRAELDKLRTDPVFQKELEILKKLERMKNAPLRYSDEARRCLGFSGLFDANPIDALGLSVRALNSLNRAGINTISDIVSYPKDQWLRIRNLSHQTLEEVVEKMHLIGYESFGID